MEMECKIHEITIEGLVDLAKVRTVRVAVTPKTSYKLQLALFNAGFSWAAYGTIPMYVNEPYLEVKRGVLSYGDSSYEASHVTHGLVCLECEDES